MPSVSEKTNMKSYKLIVKCVSLVRRTLDFITRCLFLIIYKAPSETLPPITDLLLLESATSLAHKIRIGKLKSRTLVEAYINRIKEIQPILNVTVDQRFEEALNDAEQVDALLSSGSKTEEQLLNETPFLGIPFTCKDSIANKGLSHTAGLYARKGIKAEKDADVVEKLRKAGGIPLAVTNISELCMWWESNNNIYGRSNNPYHTSHIVGGSSGGEAGLLSAAGSIIGIGSDVGGSIRMPCFFCGIFGHKPSTGIVSNSGQIPAGENEFQYYLTTGPMCRHATDLKPLFQIMAGNNVTHLKLDSKVDVSKIKIYYTLNEITNPIVSPVCQELKDAQLKVLKHFQNSYGTKAQKMDLPKFAQAFEIYTCLLACADSPSFCAEMAQRQGEASPFRELFKWFFGLSRHTFPALALGLMEKTAPGRNSEPHVLMQNLLTDFRREMQEFLLDDGVFVYPSHPEPAPFHNQPIFKPLNFIYTAIFNMLGFPVTQVPLGLGKDGLPLGIQVVSNFNNDHLTLAMAVELEKAFGGWVSPSTII